MKNILFILTLSVLSFPLCLKAQIEKLIVETYYVSDANDSTDNTGGGLEVGSKTYRVYIDLAVGSRITKIFGDKNHLLKISSTANFFNNIDNGQSFGKDIDKRRLKNNTVALDTWLTIGLASKTVSSKAYFGILKTQDKDGSIIGGSHNDGGSAGIASGLLNNADPAAGIPVDSADGLTIGYDSSSTWLAYGDQGFGSASDDSTIFSSLVPGSEFITNNAVLQNAPGISGVVPDSNQVLVAQLTTKGEISFELNVEVVEANGDTVKFVTNDSILVGNEQKSPFLKYPPPCGCKDPSYIEYSANYACSDDEACKTLVVFGCMDPFACNFDPKANFSVPSLCCYPGLCNDRDLGSVCPALSTNRISAPGDFSVYPNPALDGVTLQIPDSDNKGTKYEIYDSFGRLILDKNLGVVSGTLSEQLDISKFAKGLYIVRLFIGDTSWNKTFMKN